MKKILSLGIALATMFSIGITSVAQNVADEVRETTVTMSIEEFTEIAERVYCGERG